MFCSVAVPLCLCLCVCLCVCAFVRAFLCALCVLCVLYAVMSSIIKPHQHQPAGNNEVKKQTKHGKS